MHISIYISPHWRQSQRALSIYMSPVQAMLTEHTEHLLCSSLLLPNQVIPTASLQPSTVETDDLHPPLPLFLCSSHLQGPVSVSFSVIRGPVSVSFSVKGPVSVSFSVKGPVSVSFSVISLDLPTCPDIDTKTSLNPDSSQTSLWPRHKPYP